MTDEEHKRVLAAGAEFYSSIKGLLERFGLDDSHAPSLVLMAVGAVLRTTNMTPGTLADAGNMCSKYWYFDPNAPLQARFEDPSNGEGSN
jgi:hypothetical protein